MRVLIVNNHHKQIGGAEKYYFDLAELLVKRGHKVAFFSTRDKDNVKSRWSRYFIKKLDFKKKSLKNSLDKFPKIFYSFEAKRHIGKILDEFKPDIVHLQNIYYYITPSILSEIKKRDIPIVQTIHDYQLISPSVIMHHDGSICEITKKDKFYKALFHRCVKHSYLATLMSVVTLYFQNINRYYQRSINVFISPSKFMKNKLIEYGYPSGKIVQINNFLNAPKNETKAVNKRYVLYFGRICEAKGIFTILKAAEKLNYIEFKIAGNFEDEDIKSKVLEYIRNKKIKNISFLGFKNDRDVRKLVAESCLTIVPSEWYENQPYSILESLALGKTVVVTKIGGVTEIITDNVNGMMFKAKDSKRLIEIIEELVKNPKKCQKLGQNGKQTIKQKFNPETHYKKIIGIYEKLLNEN